MKRKRTTVMVLLPLLVAGCASRRNVPAAKKQQVTVRPVEKAALVVLAGKDVPEENADVVRAALAKQLLRRYELELLWGKQFEEALSGSAGNGPAAECGRKVEEFAAAVERLQLGKAGGLWAEIEKSLSSCGPWLDEGKLVKLLVTRARLSMTTGRKAEAEEAFRKLVTMYPKLEPSAAGIDGKILGPFQTARQQVLSGLVHPLNMESTPAGAEVFVDGRHACRTPCKLQLYSGMHFLRVKLAGHTTWVKTLDGGVPPERMAPSLIPLYRGDAASVLGDSLFESSGDAEMLARLADLAEFYGVGGLVLVRLTKEGRALLSETRLFFLRERALTWPLKVSLGSSPKAWRATTRSLARSLKALAKPKKHQKKRRKQSRKRKRR